MPISLTLYDADQEPVAIAARLYIPWRLVKAARRLLPRLVEPVTGDVELTLRALAAEALGLDPTDLANASVEELATVARQAAAAWNGAPVADDLVDTLLVSKVGWSLADIDATDAHTLRTFLAGLVKAAPEKAPEKGAQTNRPGQVYADEVNWL